MTANDFATQLSLGVEPAHNNRNLFSDHYLDVLLQSGPRWQAAAEEAASSLLWLHEKYTAEGANFAGYNEHQRETHWFRPIFERLGHVYEGQPTVPGLGAGVRQPDYAFFPTDEARQRTLSFPETAQP